MNAVRPPRAGARPALLAAVLAVVLAAVPTGALVEVAWSLRLLFDVPAAVAAVAAAVLSTRRRQADHLAVNAGLAASAAVLAVGAGGALVLSTAPGMSLGATLSRVPTQAALAMVVVGTAIALAQLRRRRHAVRTSRTDGTSRGVRGTGALRHGTRRALFVSLLLPVVGGTVVLPEAASAATEPAIVRPCTPGDEDRDYSVAGVTVDLPFNRWGRQLRSARIFVLEQDRAATQHWATPLAARVQDDPAANRRLRPRPLVLRANEGECVKVTMTNRLSDGPAHGLPGNPRVGIEASGMVVDLRQGGGARVGYGEDRTAGIDETLTYYWRVPAQEGLFLFQDMATPAGGEHDGGSRGIGLYGAVAVEPAGSTWTDPRSGAVLSGNGGPGSTYAAARSQSGELYVEADIHPPGAPSFRESVQLAQDEIPGVGMGFNYGSEPMADREKRACPDCVGEETWLSSWPYGDPALVKLASGPGPWLPTESGDSEDCGLPESCFVSNVFHAYTGDPTKIRFGLSGVKETHVFHLHAHQWLADPRDNKATGKGPGWKPESTTIDSQSFGPGEAYTADLLFGAGSRNQTFGDSIFHCHLYPHFADGFWSILRVHDVTLDGTTATPDHVNVRPLVPLPGRKTLPKPTASNPGYPGMVPGTYGWRAPQPPGSVTEGGMDGTRVRPAPRLVAGRSIDAVKLAVERAVMTRRNKGTAPRGAPFANPCPKGAREVDYAVTVLQRDLIYNEAGHHDPQARVMVLTRDVADVLAGRKKVEPLFIRVNAGDCVNFSLTNMAPNWVGGDAFQTLQQTNMAGGHVHLVKFDVTASDGGSNGWNYQQAAFTREQAELTRKQVTGEVTCRPGEGFYGAPSTGCRVEHRREWTPPKDSRGLWGQTIHERWFADYELRTAFTHDHHFAALVQNHGHFGALIVEPAGFDVRDAATGAYRQPVNDAKHGKVCGRRCSGTATGESVDLVGPGANDDYREYGLAVADFVPLVKKGGDPRRSADVVGAPVAPEHFPSQDPGTMAINYRNAPLALRGSRNGKPVDPAHRFSSWVFGDPRTPLLQAYSRDNVKLRVIQGSQEEQHLFQAHGLRWREEPDDPGSPLVAAQTIGISEAFNAEVTGFDCQNTDAPCRGDHLYGGTSLDDLWNGMWGILRVHGAPTPGLRALPDNAPKGRAVPAPAPASVQAPPRARRPGVSCPAGAPVRTYDVVAMAAPLTYNEHGDSDPRGLLYTLAEDEQAARAGKKKPEPLVIRANAGDCVKVRLRNALPPDYARHVNGLDGDVPLVLEPDTGTPMGTRVSLHPQLVRHDVRLSDGAAVGFNPDSTAGIGETVRYEWYADTELGGTNLVDFGDVRGHRHHGLFGGLVVEPRYASYHDPRTGAEVRSGTVADVRVPGRGDFRELALLYQDGMDLRDKTGAAVEDTPHPADAAAPLDPAAGDGEDAGEKGVNYANAPLHRRLGAAPGAAADTATSRAWADVFSSTVHGDPSTPILRTRSDDQVRVRILHGAVKPRQLGFTLQGASWRQEPYDEQSETVAVQGGVGPGKAVNVHTRLSAVGDHLWYSPTSVSLPQGVWGMVRVEGPDSTLVPLERTQATVGVFDDSDGDGTRDQGEEPAAGVRVRLRAVGGAVLAERETGPGGVAEFSPPRGVYDVEVVAPGDRAVVGPTARRVDLRADAAAADIAVGLAPVAPVTAVVFEDRDADGTRDEGEPGLPNWSVGLTGRAAVPSAVTNSAGTATFPDVVAGTWKATVRPRSGWRTTVPGPAPVTQRTVAIGVSRVDGVTVRAVADADGDGVVSAGDRPLEGLVVEGATTDGTATRTAADATVERTDADGTAVVGAAAGRVRLLRPDTGLPWATVDVPAGAGEVVALGRFDEGIVSTTLFDDADSDGRRDPGEAPLTGWPVAIVTSDGKTQVAQATTDNAGRAWHVVPAGRYDLVPVAPAAAVAWKATTAATTVDVGRATSVEASGGWVQPGSISVGVYHDRDRDGTRDPEDDPLAERTVRLLDADGDVVATSVTDGTGRTAFPVRAGSRYAVEAPTPRQWAPTAPRRGRSVATRVLVTAPADGRQSSVEFGHYGTVDQLPPGAPVVTPGGGALRRPTSVRVSAETGATIRYTLDRTAPTASRGMLYLGPVLVSTDRLLRAVAIDAAGNVSDVTAVGFDLPWKGRAGTWAPQSWVTSTGTGRGTAADVRTLDGRSLVVASASAGRGHAVRTAPTAVLSAHLRSPAAITVSVTLRSSLRRTSVQVQWFDVRSRAWRGLTTVDAGLDAGTWDLDLPSPARAVGKDGAVRFRLVGGHAEPFDLSVDQFTVTAVNAR